MFVNVWKQRSLLFQLTKRDILQKYRGSFLGLCWSLLLPLLMLLLYTIVFGFFMGNRGQHDDHPTTYALFIYVGLIVFNFVSECLMRSTTIIVSNPNFVKKVVFPLEIYAVVIIGSSIFQLVLNMGILSLFCWILGKIYLTMLLVPLLLLPLVLMTLGMSWVLSSVGVYFRDVSYVVTVFMQVLMYLSAIFYDANVIPVSYRSYFLLNPLVYFVSAGRALILEGIQPDWSSYGMYFILSVMVAVLGLSWFQKSRAGFADVL